MNGILRKLIPHLPHRGPPVPEALPGWPATIDDIEKAVCKYRESVEMAMHGYRRGMERATEHQTVTNRKTT